MGAATPRHLAVILLVIYTTTAATLITLEVDHPVSIDIVSVHLHSAASLCASFAFFGMFQYGVRQEAQRLGFPPSLRCTHSWPQRSHLLTLIEIRLVDISGCNIRYWIPPNLIGNKEACLSLR